MPQRKLWEEVSYCVQHEVPVWIELRQSFEIVWSGEWAYTSQGERPSTDLVRQVLISCGMSWTVHKIAPVVADANAKKKN
jgi:hypothetical protein